MNHRDINLEIEELKDQIKVLDEENKKLKKEIKDFIVYEGELKAQLITEKCMKY